MIVASIDTRTAATTLFALPRNIQHAPFPPGSPAADRFPDGFHNPRAPASGDYLLNNVAEYGRAHPTLAPSGPTTDRGLNLLMSSITTMLGLPMSHYVVVNMRTARGPPPRPASIRSTRSCCTARARCSNAASRW